MAEGGICCADDFLDEGLEVGVGGFGGVRCFWDVFGGGFLRTLGFLGGSGDLCLL